MNDNTPPTRRVLLVEDDDDLRATVAEALTALGFDVDPVEDGRAALEHLRARRPDIVVLDLMMPVMDGWEFRIHQRRDPSVADTPVVALSASHDATAAAVDADMFLRKPCSANAIAAAIEDVLATRRRLAEPARAAQTERMAALGTLAAGIVHEINNPLTYILLHLNQALRMVAPAQAPIDRPGVERLHGMLESALSGIERIREIARGIRTFSHADEQPRDALDPRAPLDAAIGLVDHELRHRAHLIRVDRGVPFVRADEGRLAQVFLNLLTNALQALRDTAPSANQIRVATFTDDDGRAVVEVGDTGVGIAANNLDHVFEPFFTTKPAGQGTGLGLSISHGIVRSLGGTMEVESELGTGTTFRVRLPAAVAAATRR
jgi:signal transduction histidine kinase